MELVDGRDRRHRRDLAPDGRLLGTTSTGPDRFRTTDHGPGDNMATGLPIAAGRPVLRSRPRTLFPG